MSDRGLLLARRCGTINGGDLAPWSSRAPLCSWGLNLHLSGKSRTSDTSLLQCGWSGGVVEGWRGLQEKGRLGWERWNEKVRRGQVGQGKREQRKFKARWELYFCALPCCQVNAIGLFYKWDYICWHFQCTSYTSSASSFWLLILYTVSPRLCQAEQNWVWWSFTSPGYIIKTEVATTYSHLLQG